MECKSVMLTVLSMLYDLIDGFVTECKFYSFFYAF